MHVKRFTPTQAAARAKELKESGTADFKQGAHDAAASKYSCGADYASEAGHAADSTLLAALLLNEAQCRLQLRQHASAASLCSRVLEREPQNVKALYRRAVARLEQSEYLEARRDLTAAAKLQPANRDVRAKLAACKDAAEAERAKERALCAAMFSGGAMAEEGAAKEGATRSHEPAVSQSHEAEANPPGEPAVTASDQPVTLTASGQPATASGQPAGTASHEPAIEMV